MLKTFCYCRSSALHERHFRSPKALGLNGKKNKKSFPKWHLAIDMEGRTTVYTSNVEWWWGLPVKEGLVGWTKLRGGRNGSEENGKEGHEEQSQEKGSCKEEGRQKEEVVVRYAFIRLEQRV
jgi:hypothetical protein